MIQLLADENFDNDVVRGVLRRRPQLDLLRVQDVGLSATPDPDILAWAATNRRVVLSHDARTMIHHAAERIRAGQPMAGLFIVKQERAPLSTVIEDLLLLDSCSETAEWQNRIEYLPLS
jgi:predicted nuclease of predicted toxin-antitoxin system